MERRGHVIVIVVVLLVLVLALAVALTRPAAALCSQTDVVSTISDDPGCDVTLLRPTASSTGPKSDAAEAAMLQRADRRAAGLAVVIDVKTGRRLAEQWCSGCHVVDANSRVDQAPTFETIAMDPLKTPEWLRAWLMTPHSTMPDLTLSRSEVEAIIAYLKSLGDG